MKRIVLISVFVLLVLSVVFLYSNDLTEAETISDDAVIVHLTSPARDGNTGTYRQ
ncbi:hypothetical protein [Methanolobus halotolerans]|uniref:hypothetical protein n=1 Tax=Methanolobus halotolerans TaxID=2052935 RepID=UPI001436BD3D|nr:hypothetical protein [Methanolobus halotolerans]